jgi:heavy metal efflux system protein
LSSSHHSKIRLAIETVLHNRPLILLCSFLLVAFGCVAWNFLPVEAYPELADPQVRIITLYPGKGPEELERLVTLPLEKELNGIPGQTALRSISINGLSVITTVFQDGTPTVLARNQVLERIDKVALPDGADLHLEPDVGSLREIYRYTLQSSYYSPMSLRAIQEWDLEKAFRQIPGVIGVVSEGGPTKTYRVNVDANRLKANNLTLQQVYNTLTNSNASTGGGFIERNGEALIVRSLGLLNSIQDIQSVVVSSNQNGVPIRISDIATVDIGPRVRRGQAGLDHDNDVVEGIVLLRRGENPSAVLERLYKKLPEIKKQLPDGVELVPLYDRSELIKKTLVTVGENVGLGILLVISILGFFFLDLRAALITAVVIPLSVLFAFCALRLVGVSANLLSLGAIDFGILVDGAVVMTENIVRKLSEEGEGLTHGQRIHLAIHSAGEAGRPVIFGILTIITTFLPIFTFGSIEGKLFRPLAITMVSALIGAGILALTLIPTLCCLLLTRKPLKEQANPVVEFMHHHYSKGLKAAISHPRWLISAGLVVLTGTTLLFFNLGSEFLPHLEEGNIWLRTTIKPGSVTLAESVDVARQVRETLLKYPEVKKVLSQEGGPDDGSDPARFGDHEYLVDLKLSHDWRPRFHRNKEELIAAMNQDLQAIPNVDYYFTQYIQTTLDESLSGVQGSLVAKIAGPDLRVLETLSEQIGPIMRNTRGIVDVIVDPLLGQPQLAITIDREKAARYGVNVSDLSNLVETAVGGKAATQVVEGEKRFDLMVRLQAPFRNTEAALENILVDTPSGGKIPLSQFAIVDPSIGATQIWREAGHRLATIRANVRGRDLATAVDDAQARVAKQVKFPEGYQLVWSGEFQRQREATEQIKIVLPITLGIILVILHMALNSLRSALIVFCVIPMASIGGILALYFAHMPFSIAAGVGFIALFGVATQNGIFLVSFIEELHHQGKSLKDAVLEGAYLRMRPILMTATVAMLGLLPAAISNEIGAQTQKPFAVVIIGGLISATILSLFFLPTMYGTFASEAIAKEEDEYDED